MEWRPGQTLGPYEIVAPVGAGGMGEVYRARDTRLGREVAVKVLPHALRSNPDALARFEREARAVAALSHPNILAIHDFGADEQAAYAVVELLDGETLREALAAGPLPPRRAVELARQAARGLGAAHDGNVVHRDVKPENLFVTREGRIKILDFGLAATAGETGATADSATRTHLTEPGTVLGTIQYMSPEQARGEPAGPASDIFSLGSVLYEMLTGRRPFERETAPETMTAILREDPPDLASTEPPIPPAVQRIVLRCLEKQPGERFHSAHDLAFALGSSSEISSGASTLAEVAPRKRRSVGWPVVAALAVGLAVGALLHAWLASGTARELVKIAPITFSGYDRNPAASPDGRTVAFASRRGDVGGIWVKQLHGGGEAPLTSGDDDFPRFSPDGSSVLFTRSEGGRSSIFRIPLVGGGSRKVVDGALEGDWSPDGSRIVFTRMDPVGAESIGLVHADGSGERTLVELPGQQLASPRWSPDGGTVVFTTSPINNLLPHTVMLLDVDTGELRALAPPRPSVSGLAWSGAGRHIVYGWSEDLLSGLASTEVLLSMQDCESGRTTDLFWSSNLVRANLGTRIDIAGPGRLVFGAVGAMQSLREITPGADPTVRILTTGNSVDRQPVYHPDGETILFSSNRSGNLDLWTIHLPTGAVLPVTDDEARDWDPAYVGDGSRITWSSDRSGNLEIWTANADGSGARQVSHDGADAENPTATPDGAWIVYITSNPDKRGMWKVRSDGSEAVHLWEGPGFIPQLSPDGRHVAFNVIEEQANNRMMILDLDTGEVTPFSGALARGGTAATLNAGRARWFDGGRSIAFVAKVDEEVGVVAQDFVPGRDTKATARKLAGFDPEWSVESFDISPEGERLVVSRIRPGGTVMLAENVRGVMPPQRD